MLEKITALENGKSVLKETIALRTDIFEDLSSMVYRDSDSEVRDRRLHIV